MKLDRRTDRRRSPSMCQSCGAHLTHPDSTKPGQAHAYREHEGRPRMACPSCPSIDNRGPSGNRRRFDERTLADLGAQLDALTNARADDAEAMDDLRALLQRIEAGADFLDAEPRARLGPGDPGRDPIPGGPE